MENTLLNQLDVLVQSLDAKQLVETREKQPKEVKTLENTLMGIKEATQNKVIECKEAVKNTANKVVNKVNSIKENIVNTTKKVVEKINLSMLVMVAVIIFILSSWLIINHMENKLNNEYETAVNSLQKVETTVSFDSTNYFFFGDTNSLLNELEDHNVKYKTIDNNRYYVVLDIEDNQNIILKYDTIEKSFSWYGKFDIDTADTQYKKDSIEAINLIL